MRQTLGFCKGGCVRISTFRSTGSTFWGPATLLRKSWLAAWTLCILRAVPVGACQLPKPWTCTDENMTFLQTTITGLRLAWVPTKSFKKQYANWTHYLQHLYITAWIIQLDALKKISNAIVPGLASCVFRVKVWGFKISCKWCRKIGYSPTYLHTCLGL